MDRKVVGVTVVSFWSGCKLHWLHWSLHPQVLDVASCTAAVVVAVSQWNCSCHVLQINCVVAVVVVVTVVTVVVTSVVV